MHNYDIRAVGFDYDGTVVHSYLHGMRYIRDLAVLHSLPFTKETERRVREHWGVPGPELLALCFGISLEQAEFVYKDWFTLEQQRPLPLIRGARKTLTMLRGAGIKCGLITSRTRDSLDPSLKRGRLLDSFIHTAARGETVAHKPDPLVFSCWLNKLRGYGIKPHQVAYVGDGGVDVDAALGAGMIAIAVETGPKHQLKTRKPSVTFSTIAHVGPWILKQPYPVRI